MYASTLKVFLTISLVVIFFFWGTVLLFSKLPQEPKGPPTYVELYKDCMGGNTQYGSSNECKELAIKEMEQYERTSTKSN